ncbi:MAG: hypothetical protein JXO22_17005 [Phycisphaerae bacterium]|nr:hypothetical protein [Phycisphaerae bacterium]
MKRNVPLLITAIVGFILILSAFIPNIKALSEETAVYFDIIAAFALVLGGGNLLRAHGHNVYKQAPGWGYSAVTVVAFLGTLIIGIGKVAVPPHTGLHTLASSGNHMALVTLDGTQTKRDMIVTLRGAEANAEAPIVIDGTQRGVIKTDERGNGALTLEWKKPAEESAEPAENEFLSSLNIPEVIQRPESEAPPPPAYVPIKVQVGSLTGQLEPYGRLTGDHIANGSWFWYIYEHIYKPLQATMFAMLAFYVASAAFRAFRARNMESIMLLGTAFIILLGRTALGAWFTYHLPEENFWSFFRIENLSNWIMLTFNTAGNRAIMIGISLGIAATSLKVLLGIDRSYLGSDKG